jgi:hypothetical protein
MIAKAIMAARTGERDPDLRTKKSVPTFMGCLQLDTVARCD